MSYNTPVPGGGEFNNGLIISNILVTGGSVSINRDDSTLQTINHTGNTDLYSQITSMSLPNLTTVSGEIQFTTPALTTLSLPLLATVGTALTINGPSMTTLSLPALTSIGGTVDIENLGFATSIDLSALTSSAVFQITNNSALLSVDISSLTSCQGISIFSMSTLTTITINQGLDDNSSGYYFFANALSQAVVDDILSKLDAGGLLNRTLTLNGGTNSSPTGGATNANYLSLIAKGWTVLIN